MQDLQTFLEVRDRLAEFLREDIGSGDITSECIVPEDLDAVAKIICKSISSVVVSGLEEAAIIFDICGCHAKALKSDGCTIGKGAVVMSISGNARAILKAERTALNLIMRMSGISTETKQLVNAARGPRILATRKTAPGIRFFDKKAVVLGGGGSHRMRLDDMILIKDNHLRFGGSPSKCIAEARIRAGPSGTIECEATNKAEAIEAVSAGADVLMLDNFTPDQAKRTIQALSKMGLRKKAKIEISGGVNLQNIRQYARANPDFISLGFITHSARAVDFSLEMKPVV